MQTKLNSLTELSCQEIQYISGGVDHRGLIKAALVSAAVKTGAYYIAVLLPKGEKGTFVGELWNGAVKGISSFISAVSLGIVGEYIVTAVQRNPNIHIE